MRTPETLLLALALLAATPPGARADVVVLDPVLDNTLYEDLEGVLSNGLGDHFFAGMTGQGRVVRGLLEFDVAGSVPAGSTVTSASLSLNMSMTNNAAAETVSLHRVLAPWGEGTSDAAMGEGGGAPATAGDATWFNTFFATTLWSTPGGDFAPGPSASTAVAGVGSYAFTSAGLAADVSLFANDDSMNHGWIVIGNEAALAKRFDTRHVFTSLRPKLTIDFTPPPPVQTPALAPLATALLAVLLVGAAVRLRRP